MWRQNRRQITPTCIGADLNRNFAQTWQAATFLQPCGSLTFRNLKFNLNLAVIKILNLQLDLSPSLSLKMSLLTTLSLATTHKLRFT